MQSETEVEPAGDQARATSNALEKISILLTLMNIVLAMFTEGRVWQHMRHGDEDYRVRMIKRQLEEHTHKEKKLLEKLHLNVITSVRPIFDLFCKTHSCTQ